MKKHMCIDILDIIEAAAEIAFDFILDIIF